MSSFGQFDVKLNISNDISNEISLLREEVKNLTNIISKAISCNTLFDNDKNTVNESTKETNDIDTDYEFLLPNNPVNNCIEIEKIDVKIDDHFSFEKLLIYSNRKENSKPYRTYLFTCKHCNAKFKGHKIMAKYHIAGKDKYNDHNIPVCKFPDKIKDFKDIHPSRINFI